MIHFVHGWLLAMTLPGVVLVVNFIKSAFRGSVGRSDFE